METASTSALYPTRVAHLHRSPIQHYAKHRSYSWYVDIDDLPQLPRWLRPFARFEGVDHLDGRPGDSLRQRVDTFLATHGVSLPGGRVTALLMPRVLGRTFTPLSLFWCHDDIGELRFVIAEVQDVDGGRIAYLVPAGDGGPVPVTRTPGDTATDGGGGYFLVRVPEPGDHLDLTVSQHRDNHAAMVATWRGNRRRATVGAVLLMQLTNPLAPQMAAFGVRFQSLVLRIRGVSATPRTATRGSNRAPQHAAPAGSGWAAGGRSLAPS